MIFKTNILPETVNFGENEFFIHGRKNFFFRFFCPHYLEET